MKGHIITDIVSWDEINRKVYERTSVLMDIDRQPTTNIPFIAELNHGNAGKDKNGTAGPSWLLAQPG